MSELGKAGFAIALLSIVRYKDVVGFMEDAINNYKANDSEKAKKEIETCASMLTIKAKIDREGSEQVMKEIEDVESITNPIIQKMQGKDN